ncbi:MAG: hypothetical protein Q9178_005757 [Gyalolechia marmorata]
MEWPGYQATGGRTQRRTGRSSSPSPPPPPIPPPLPPLGYRVRVPEKYKRPYYGAENGYGAHEGEPFVPIQNVPYPLVPPSLPRLVNSRAARPQPGIYDRERDRRRDRSFDEWDDRAHFLQAAPRGREPNHHRHRFYNDGEDLAGHSDDDLDDLSDLKLNLQEGQASETKPSPYIETVERIDHSRYCFRSLDPDDVTARLITSAQHVKSPPTTASLFEWIHLQTETQSFASFMSYVSILLCKAQLQQEQVSDLLHEVRQKYEHHIAASGNMKGKYLDPNLAPGEPTSGQSKAKKNLPAFVAHFSAIVDNFEKNYVVSYRQSVQGPKEWASLIAIATEQTVRLVLRSRRGINNKLATENVVITPPASTGLKEAVQQSSEVAEKEGMDAQSSASLKDRKTQTSQSGDDSVLRVSRATFHLYYWLSAVPRPGNALREGSPSGSTDSVSGQSQSSTMFDVDLKKFTNYVEEMIVHTKQNLNTALIEPSSNAATRQSPVNCTPRSLEEVEARLAEIRDACNTTDTHDQSAAEPPGGRHQDHSGDGSDAQDGIVIRRGGLMLDESQLKRQRCEKIVSLAKQVYQFLLPLEISSLESWVASKFWGTVYWYLENPDAKRSIHVHDLALRTGIQHKLRAVARDLKYGPHPLDIQIPDELRQSGLELVAMFFWGTCERQIKLLHKRFRRSEALLLIGRRKLFQSIAPESIETMEAVLPSGLVAVLIRKLMEDITEGAPDICTTYYDYITRLDLEIQKRPHSRTHQEKLASFRQEVNCIIGVLEDQTSIVSQLQEMLNRGEDMTWSLGRRREDSILRRCLTTLEDRISNFNSLERHARELTSFNLLRVESSKDRQEAAILVFTIVTIIFLPLSFVSSFFGMNTTDIRDTKFPQWIFWVSALPLTILVVVISLFVAHKIEPLKDLWTRVQDKLAAYQEGRRTEMYYGASPRPLRRDDESQQSSDAPRVSRRDVVDSDDSSSVRHARRRRPGRFIAQFSMELGRRKDSTDRRRRVTRRDRSYSY